MTCREKLKIERPDCITETATGGCVLCPHSYGYMDRPEWCNSNSSAEDMFDACDRCWDREIPGTEELAEVKSETPKILDSGTRREFESGAVRDIQEGKGRCDLLPLDVVADYYATDYSLLRYVESERVTDILNSIYRFQETGDHRRLLEALYATKMFEETWTTMFLEVSKHFEEGAKKYGEDNWQKGIPTHCYIDSAVRHYLKWIRGDKDEPHDRAFCWNILCCIWTCKHKPELNDYARKEEKNG